MRKGLIIQLLASASSSAPSLSSWRSIPWLPPLGSEQGGRIDDVYWLTSIICLVIFAIVAAVSVYAVIKFRARPDDDEDGKPIHGHTGLEMFWTAVPAVLVTVIAIYSGIVLVKNEDLPAGQRTVRGHGTAVRVELRLPGRGGRGRRPSASSPSGRRERRARDAGGGRDPLVLGPEWRVKQDVVPGTIQPYIVTPTKDGALPDHLHGALRHRPLGDARPGSSARDVDAGASVGGRWLEAADFDDLGGCHPRRAVTRTTAVGAKPDTVS